MPIWILFIGSLSHSLKCNPNAKWLKRRRFSLPWLQLEINNPISTVGELKVTQTMVQCCTAMVQYCTNYIFALILISYKQFCRYSYTILHRFRRYKDALSQLSCWIPHYLLNLMIFSRLAHLLLL